MSFRDPEVFYAFFLLLPLGFFLWRAYRRSFQDLTKMGGAWRGHRLEAVFFLKSFVSGVLLLGTVLFLVLAWAGPTWGRSPVEEPQDGLDIALAVDVSRSMTASDTMPSRLEAARESVRQLISAFPSARFSLVAFEGSARTLTPLTPDKDVLDEWVNELSPQILSLGGSNLAAGLNEAVRTVKFSAVHHRAIVVFSDGENRDGNLLNAARAAASQSVVVYTLAYGTSKGATIPDHGGVLRDEFGFPVTTKKVASTLRLLASETGGQAFDGTDRNALRSLQDNLATLGNSASRGGVGLVPISRYRVFLVLALLCLTAGVVVRLIPWKESL